MNIGDKVRALHEDIEGYISKFLPNDIIEVEIEDGFGIPVHKKELVIVSSQEAEFFEEGTVVPKKPIPKIAKIICDNILNLNEIPDELACRIFL